MKVIILEIKLIICQTNFARPETLAVAFTISQLKFYTATQALNFPFIFEIE